MSKRGNEWLAGEIAQYLQKNWFLHNLRESSSDAPEEEVVVIAEAIEAR